MQNETERAENPQLPAIQSNLAPERMESKGKKVKAGKSLSEYALLEISERDKVVVKGFNGWRIQHYAAIGEAFPDPEVLATYPGLLRAAACKFYGFVEKDGTPLQRKALSKDKTDATATKMLRKYDSVVGVPVSECKAVFDSFISHYSDTLKLLKGKGGYADKIKALPSKAARQRGTQSKESEARGTTAKPEQEQLKAILSAINAAPFAWLPQIAQALAARCKQSPDKPMQLLGGDIVDSLTAFDNAPEWQENQQPAAQEGELKTGTE